jgi:hypothetical protein
MNPLIHKIIIKKFRILPEKLKSKAIIVCFVENVNRDFPGCEKKEMIENKGKEKKGFAEKPRAASKLILFRGFRAFSQLYVIKLRVFSSSQRSEPAPSIRIPVMLQS